MDILSDVAAVWALVGATKKVVGFITDLKEAKDDRAKIVHELQGCCRIPEKIATSVERDAESLPNLASLVFPNGPLDQYKHEIEELVPKLTTARGLGHIGKKCRFVAGKKDIQDALSMLERCKSTFWVCLDFDQTQILLGFNTKLDLIASGPVIQAYRQSRPMVPFPLDTKSFIGREELITALTQGFTKHSRMALYGLGGVGKSQIATEYLCRLHQTEPEVAIFWVSMADRSRFLKSYEALALEIPESFRKDHSLLITDQVFREDPSTNSKTLMLVKDWLSSEHSGKWLFILDNADDPDVFGSMNDHEKSMIPYIPRSSNGHILITSRFQRVALTLVSGGDFLIHVTPMTPQEAVSLLQTRVPDDQSTEGVAIELVKALDCLPLAIKQAIGYIIATNTSIKDYYRLFSKDENYQRRLLEKTYGDISRETHNDLQDSVILTWQISFDQIRHQRPAAANVLSLMGTLNREGIPIDLLTGLSVDELEFQENIGILIQYSLISRNEDFVSFSMHRLVQLTIQIWLSSQGTLGEWQTEALRLVSKSFSLAVDEKIPAALLYIPHASVVVNYRFETKVDREPQMNLKEDLRRFDEVLFGILFNMALGEFKNEWITKAIVDLTLLVEG